MDRTKQYEFARLCIEEIAKCVGRTKQIGLANGLQKEEIKEVWETAFKLLARDSGISIQKMSQNIRRRKAPQEAEPTNQ